MNDITIISNFDSIDSAEICASKIKSQVIGITKIDIQPVSPHVENETNTGVSNATQAFFPSALMGFGPFNNPGFPMINLATFDPAFISNNVDTYYVDSQRCNLHVMAPRHLQNQIEAYIINSGGIDTKVVF